ncbi:hypothetical protein WICPIJ_005294 [Wickerhamomyces pijperi]|uniref:Uncharacterized protein n=1 Tax=Wickerhamomyces pijperi TaxID=599730 RepID=A0A9P8TL91_WICPI|nr:hypothetical protein WICPIJ_005294 [Wickerhamomyces pijperi]
MIPLLVLGVIPIVLGIESLLLLLWLVLVSVLLLLLLLGQFVGTLSSWSSGTVTVTVIGGRLRNRVVGSLRTWSLTLTLLLLWGTTLSLEATVRVEALLALAWLLISSGEHLLLLLRVELTEWLLELLAVEVVVVWVVAKCGLWCNTILGSLVVGIFWLLLLLALLLLSVLVVTVVVVVVHAVLVVVVELVETLWGLVLWLALLRLRLLLELLELLEVLLRVLLGVLVVEAVVVIVIVEWWLDLLLLLLTAAEDGKTTGASCCFGGAAIEAHDIVLVDGVAAGTGAGAGADFDSSGCCSACVCVCSSCCVCSDCCACGCCSCFGCGFGLSEPKAEAHEVPAEGGAAELADAEVDGVVEATEEVEARAGADVFLTPFTGLVGFLDLKLFWFWL